MPYNPYNPYNNPYTPQTNYGGYAQPYQPQKPLFDFVNGIEGAKSYQMGPGQTAFLFDNENSACYIKTTNGMGVPSIEYFKVAKCTEQDIRGVPQQNNRYATLEQFGSLDARLKAIESSLAPKEAK